MSARIALATLVLAACTGGGSDAGDDQPGCPLPRPGCPSQDACDSGGCVDVTLYECDESTLEWVDSGVICEGVFVEAAGELVLTQSVLAAAASCPPLAPRVPLVLSVQDDGTITAPAPITVVEGTGTSGYETATVQAILEDDWGGVAATADYDLAILPSGAVEGGAVVTATSCDAELEVDGELCPRGAVACTIFDDGWNVQCFEGSVYSDDLTRYTYCLPGETTPVCETGGEGNLTRVATCMAGCADTTLHWFETVEEYNAFDPATLCAP